MRMTDRSDNWRWHHDVWPVQDSKPGPNGRGAASTPEVKGVIITAISWDRESILQKEDTYHKSAFHRICRSKNDKCGRNDLGKLRDEGVGHSGEIIGLDKTSFPLRDFRMKSLSDMNLIRQNRQCDSGTPTDKTKYLGYISGRTVCICFTLLYDAQ